MVEDFLELFRSETDVITLEPGQELFKKGDVGRHMYVVKSGEVQIIDDAKDYETFAEAILKKLITEIAANDHGRQE